MTCTTDTGEVCPVYESLEDEVRLLEARLRRRDTELKRWHDRAERWVDALTGLMEDNAILQRRCKELSTEDVPHLSCVLCKVNFDEFSPLCSHPEYHDEKEGDYS